jgi:hypothetical protein
LVDLVAAKRANQTSNSLPLSTDSDKTTRRAESILCWTRREVTAFDTINGLEEPRLTLVQHRFRTIAWTEYGHPWL